MRASYRLGRNLGVKPTLFGSRTFRILSDLHLEYNKVEDFAFLDDWPKTDFLILAGDICTFSTQEKLDAFLQSHAHKYDKVLYVLGNHEFYDRPPHLTYQEILLHYRQFLAQRGWDNVELLENNTIALHGFLIHGTSLWSFPSKFRNSQELPLDVIRKLHYDSLRKLHQIPCESLDLIITHHLPSYKLLAPEFLMSDPSIQTDWYASNSDWILTKTKQALVHGHSHHPTKTTIFGVKILSNPFGYPKDCVLTLEHT